MSQRDQGRDNHTTIAGLVNKRLTYAVITGVILSIYGLLLRLLVSIAWLGPVLFLITYLIVGLVTADPKRGSLVSMVLADVFYFVSILLFQKGELVTYIPQNILLIMFNVANNSITGLLIGLVGGFLGKQYFK